MRKGEDMEKVFKVEIKFKYGSEVVNYFDNKQQAEDYANINAVFGGAKFRITEVFINEEV